MSLGGIIGASILFIIALAAILKPYMNSKQNLRQLLSSEKQHSQDELVTSYERVLAMIRDLDEDHQTGKLDPKSYQDERTYWTEQGIKLLQKIEPDNDAELPTAQSAEPDEADLVLDDAIEQAISAYRQAKT